MVAHELRHIEETPLSRQACNILRKLLTGSSLQEEPSPVRDLLLLVFSLFILIFIYRVSRVCYIYIDFAEFIYIQFA